MLAAGLSRRWGQGNKLLAPLRGRPIVRWTVETALASSLRPVIVVVGHEAEAITGALSDLPVSFATAPDYAAGMAASLKTGIAAVPAACGAAAICLGDMPEVRPATLDALAAAHETAPRAAVVPTHGGERGNPVLLDRSLFPELMALTGDKGARLVLAKYADRVAELPVADPGILQDFDTPDLLT